VPAGTAIANEDAVTEVDPLQEYIDQMSVRELIGQMVMIGFTGTEKVDSKSAHLIKKYKIGNVLLLGQNCDTFPQGKRLIKQVRSLNKSKIPLNVAIDLEGGTVVRFQGQWDPKVLSSAALGKKSVKKTYQQYYRVGKQLGKIGVDVNFAPVMDMAPNPSKTYINTRMFGSRPKAVSNRGVQAIKGLQKSGTAATAKHFPGNGENKKDPHTTKPVIKKSRKHMDKYTLVPFQAAIDNGVDGVMVAHVTYPKLDSKNVSSKSKKIITGILRKDMGFEGVVYSDSMSMRGFGGSAKSVGAGAVKFVRAGGDVCVIASNPDYQEAVCKALYEAYKDGKISRDRLEKSVYRILTLKMNYHKGFKV